MRETTELEHYHKWIREYSTPPKENQNGNHSFRINIWLCPRETLVCSVIKHSLLDFVLLSSCWPLYMTRKKFVHIGSFLDEHRAHLFPRSIQVEMKLFHQYHHIIIFSMSRKMAWRLFDLHQFLSVYFWIGISSQLFPSEIHEFLLSRRGIFTHNQNQWKFYDSFVKCVTIISSRPMS